MRKAVTLVELSVVLFILGILSGMAFPLAKIAKQREKEMLLHSRLTQVRQALDEFSREKRAKDKKITRPQSYPATLEELVKERCLRRLPEDPFTGKSDWVTVPYQSGQTAIYDLHSSSDMKAMNGEEVAKW